MAWGNTNRQKSLEYAVAPWMTHGLNTPWAISISGPKSLTGSRFGKPGRPSKFRAQCTVHGVRYSSVLRGVDPFGRRMMATSRPLRGSQLHIPSRIAGGTRPTWAWMTPPHSLLITRSILLRVAGGSSLDQMIRNVGGARGLFVCSDWFGLGPPIANFAVPDRKIGKRR